MLNVPFTPDYDQRFTSQLGDVRYVFDARWNERGQVWTLDIARESDGVQLIAGVPLLGGQDCLAPYALGIGGLFPIDLSLTDSDPGPDDFGERVIVTWFSNDELAAIRAAQRAAGRPSTIVTGVVPPTSRPRIPAGAPGSVTPVSNVTNNVTIENIANVTNVTGGGPGISKTFTGPDGITDASGNEILIGSFVQLPNLNPNPTVILELGIYANGAGSLRCYIGGTLEEDGSVGTPSGSLATTAVAVAGPDIYRISATPVNPAAPVLVKITMKSTAPATQIGVNIISGSLG
jgi:hypothetical protein